MPPFLVLRSAAARESAKLASMLGLRRKSRPKAPPSRRAERHVAVSGRSLPLEIREHAQATRITLRIAPGGGSLKLTVPRGLPKREIDAFLERQQGWLMTRLATYPAERGLSEGGTIMLRGVEHRIMRGGSMRGLTEAKLVGGAPVIVVGGLPEHLGRRLADFLKREARRDLESAVRRHTARINRRATALRFRDTKSRWGSCTSDGVLSFCWRIVMAPPEVIDYLAAHEVAHLKEMNHGPRFWALCEELCPGMAGAKAWLKRHGSQLQAVDFS